VPVKVDLGTAPITVSSFWPPLKIITVGMERIPYSVATEGLSSVFSLTCHGRMNGFSVRSVDKRGSEADARQNGQELLKKKTRDACFSTLENHLENSRAMCAHREPDKRQPAQRVTGFLTQFPRGTDAR